MVKNHLFTTPTNYALADKRVFQFGGLVMRIVQKIPLKMVPQSRFVGLNMLPVYKYYVFLRPDMTIYGLQIDLLNEFQHGNISQVFAMLQITLDFE